MSKRSKGEKGDKGDRGTQGERGKDGSNALFVASADCKETHKGINLILYGQDGRSGLIGDIQAIKTATSIVRTVVLPVGLSFMSAVLVAFLLTR
ncbi:hypothetical protein MUP79_09590 [Candidatus Bathyarchaeota archaeon]|nr:hypothetical protein [Candidatus Bathyarchaeota archaeon]